MEPANDPRADRDLCDWVAASPRRRSALLAIRQPLTAMQIGRILGVGPETGSYLFWELTTRGLTRCLNASAINNRLHWLTSRGRACRDRMRRSQGLAPEPVALPRADWGLYGELLYRHRAAVLRTMNGPKQPSEIRRHAVRQQSGLRMSANNVRDVVRFFVDRGVATAVETAGIRHRHYALTEAGLLFKKLLVAAA